MAVCDGNTHVVALGFDINNFNTKKTVAGYNSFRICKMPLRSKNITNMKVAWLLLKSTELLQMVTANLFLSFRTEKKMLVRSICSVGLVHKEFTSYITN